ncbi:alpha-ketoacid dehydrogenase subunit beta [Chloroflexota bacterium]
MTQRQITYREAVIEAIREEMTRDESVFYIGEDVGKMGGIFGTSIGLLEEFGEERVIETPISEAAIVGYAVGGAMTGMRPVAEITRIDWMTTCMDEIVNQAAKMRYLSGGRPEIPMVIRTSAGAGIGLGAQHTQSFESWFVHVPGLKVVMTSTPYDCKGLLKAVIREPNPVICIEPVRLLNLSGPVPEEDYVLPLGKADIKRQGTDVTIVAWGAVVSTALKAAETLAADGIQAEVIDPRTLSPLDIDAIIASVKRTGRLVVAHEAVKTCGVGAEISALVQEQAFDFLDAPIQRVATPFTFFPANRNLERMLLPQEKQIVEAVKVTL